MEVPHLHLIEHLRPRGLSQKGEKNEDMEKGREKKERRKKRWEGKEGGE